MSVRNTDQYVLYPCSENSIQGDFNQSGWVFLSYFSSIWISYKVHKRCYCKVYRMFPSMLWILNSNIYRTFDYKVHSVFIRTLSKYNFCHRVFELLQLYLRQGWAKAGPWTGTVLLLTLSSPLKNPACNVFIFLYAIFLK